MQTVSVLWCLGIALDCGTQGSQFESPAGQENLSGKQMCKQCNMTLVNDLVVQNIESKPSM